MITKTRKTLAVAFAASGLALAAPAAAVEAPMAQSPAYSHAPASYDVNAQHHRRGHYRGRGYNRGRGYDRGYDRGYYEEPIYRDTRIWRGNDGRYYCRRRDGTTGLLIGAAAGALLGREVAGRRGDRTLGAILGAAGGAILGRSIDRSGSRCR